MKKYLVHIILSVFLFAGIHTAATGTKFPAVEKEVCMQQEQLHNNALPELVGEGEWLNTDHLPGSSFTQNQDTRGSNTWRRVQVNKAHLLLQCGYHTRTAFAFAAYAGCIAGKLKQYSLFLFPYHFFW